MPTFRRTTYTIHPHPDHKGWWMVHRDGRPAEGWPRLEQAETYVRNLEKGEPLGAAWMAANAAPRELRA